MNSEEKVVDVVEQKAMDLLEEFQVETTEGFDVVLLAKQMGFFVANAILPDNEDGFIAVDPNNKNLLDTGSNKVIGINTKRDFYEKRFVIAHEIGHYVLCAGRENKLYAHREKKVENRDEYEQKVDFFAACLLMPRDSFINKYNELQKKDISSNDVISVLQRIFSVPFDSVVRRISELNLS